MSKLEGYLLKKNGSAFRNDWRKRYFVCDGDRLAWYDDSDPRFEGAAGKPKGVVFVGADATFKPVPSNSALSHEPVRYAGQMMLATPFEQTAAIGVISAFVGALWVSILFLTGTWDDIVQPKWDCLGRPSSSIELEFLLLWLGQGLLYAAHYIGFFYIVLYSNSVTAGVAKATQSACVFFLSSLFFCASDQAQCLTTGKIISASVVFLSVIMYAFSPPPLGELLQGLTRRSRGDGSRSLN